MDVARIGSVIVFHLSKLQWKAKFSVMCDVVFLVRLQEKFDIDHSILGVKGLTHHCCQNKAGYYVGENVSFDTIQSSKSGRKLRFHPASRDDVRVNFSHNFVNATEVTGAPVLFPLFCNCVVCSGVKHWYSSSPKWKLSILPLPDFLLLSHLQARWQHRRVPLRRKNDIWTPNCFDNNTINIHSISMMVCRYNSSQ